jgi:glycosyltransferase involved in cell wall biosynthesis
MLLSVIIPVYRVEATLDRCLCSVVQQNVDDMELILVDDGSPDFSGKICDEWSSRHEMKGGRTSIRVIHQQNRGLSAARNSGLKVAQGDYVTFVDSDDYLAPDTYRPLLDLLRQHPECDLIEFPVLRFQGSKRESLLTFRQRTFDDMREYWYGEQAYAHCYAWNKLYRRQLFEGVEFAEGVVFEDTWLLPRLLAKARHVATTDMGLYYYTANDQGITATADGQVLKSLLQAHLAAMQQYPLDKSLASLPPCCQCANHGLRDDRRTTTLAPQTCGQS